jgi:hypothetical protein
MRRSEAAPASEVAGARVDDSSTLFGYSSTGCFPAEPASASPNAVQYRTSFQERKDDTKKRLCRCVRLHRPFLTEEALACDVSLRWPVDSAKSRART